MARFDVPGRPTCLTVVGRKTFSSKGETVHNELAVKSEQHLKEKKKKGKGKEDKRTVSTSGILIPLQNFLLASAELRITLKLTSSNAKPFKWPNFAVFDIPVHFLQILSLTKDHEVCVGAQCLSAIIKWF